MSLLSKLDAPLFVLDRRMPWNRRKRNRIGVQLKAVPNMPKLEDIKEVERAGLQLIGFLRLSAIVSLGIAPLLALFFFLNDAQNDKRVAQMLDRTDQRYVLISTYQIQHTQTDLEIKAIQSKIDEAIRQRQEMSRQLDRIQASLDALKEQGKQRAERQR